MRKNSGFSIIELMVAIGIIAIIVSIGVPSLLSYREKAKLGGFARDVYGIFQKAKMEAVRRNQNCTVGFGQPGCDYVLFIDDNGAPDQVYDPATENDPALTYCLNRPPGIADSFDNFPGTYIIFANNGLPVDKNDAPAKGDVHLTSKARESVVSISLTGNVKIEKYPE